MNAVLRGALLLGDAELSNVASSSCCRELIEQAVEHERELCCRELIEQAVKHERKLCALESGCSQRTAPAMLARAQAQEELVQCIARLRPISESQVLEDDLSVEILSSAIQTLRRCRSEEGEEGTMPSSPARTLSQDVVDSFSAVRRYLREVGERLSQMESCPCRVVGFVERLVDWEESWTIAKRFVQDEELVVISDLITEIESAQRRLPYVKAMREKLDVELFAVLPELLLLRGLTEPSKYFRVFSRLLPHRFRAEQKTVPCETEWLRDDSLKKFFERFRRVRALLCDQCDVVDVSDHLVWKKWIERMAHEKTALGEKIEETVCDAPSPNFHLRTEIEVLKSEMEKWSMELQVSHAEEWNRFVSAVTRCLSKTQEEEGTSEPPPESLFAAGDRSSLFAADKDCPKRMAVK